MSRTAASAHARDEVKRLREVEFAVADDPLASQGAVEDQAGAYKGERKYGARANLLETGPRRAAPSGPSATAPVRPVSERGPRKPTLDEMTVGRTEVPLEKAKPVKPMKTIEINDDAEVKRRRGRLKKTGRPGA